MIYCTTRLHANAQTCFTFRKQKIGTMSATKDLSMPLPLVYTSEDATCGSANDSEATDASVVHKISSITVPNVDSVVSASSIETLQTTNKASTHQSMSSCDEELNLYWGFINKGRLYGRQQEAKQIEDAIERSLVPSAQPELILITGDPGVGKTALAKKAFKRLEHAKFLYGKFDQLQRLDPYAPFVQALTEHISSVLAQGKESVSRLRAAMEKQEDFGQDPTNTARWNALTIVMPSLGMILNNQPKDQVTSSFNGTHTMPDIWSQKASQTRLLAGFQKLFRVLCSPESPLVLIMDDLQWADSASLELLELLISDKDNDGFAVVGTCRNEVRTNPKVTKVIDRLQNENGVVINEIIVNGISKEATNELVADVLQQPLGNCAVLTENLFLLCKGNVFFLLQLLRALRDFKILLPHSNRQSWLWDDDRGKAFGGDSMDIHTLIRNRINALPKTAQLLLTSCACMGFENESKAMSEVLMEKFSPETISCVVDAGLMVKVVNRPGFYSFAHDYIQQAAYSLIYPDQKSITHLSIGQKILLQISPEELDHHLFLVVNQISRGISHLPNQQERTSLAHLCYRAGQKANLCCDRHTAKTHFLLGTTLINPTTWISDYQISLDLFRSLAEAEFPPDDPALMNYAIGEVLTNSRSFGDKGRAYMLQVEYLSFGHKLEEAIDACLKILQDEGEPITRGKNGWGRGQNVQTKTKKALNGKTDSDILSLPTMEDPDKLATMNILGLLVKYVFLTHEDLLPSTAYRMISLSLDHGVCPMTALGLMLYSTCMYGCSDFENGNRYSNLAMNILDRFKGTKWEESSSSCSRLIYGWIAHWQEDLRTTLTHVVPTNEHGEESGDFMWAMISGYVNITYAFFAGKPLNAVESTIKTHLDIYNGRPDHQHRASALKLLKLVQKLIGEPLVGDSEKSDIEGKDTDKTESTTVIKIFKLVEAFHFGNHEDAMMMVKECRQLNLVTRASFLVVILHFYEALTSLTLARAANQNRNTHLLAARKAFRALTEMVKHSASEWNCLHMVYLIEAEFAAVNGSIEKAIRRYNDSIKTAKDQGFLQDEALACERAHFALTCHAQSNAARTTQFLNRAIQLYTEWGAKAKVNALRKEFPKPQAQMDKPAQTDQSEEITITQASL